MCNEIAGESFKSEAYTSFLQSEPQSHSPGFSSTENKGNTTAKPASQNNDQFHKILFKLQDYTEPERFNPL